MKFCSNNLISGLSEIYKNYDFFFIDLWGVIHNGIKVFSSSKRVLQELRNNNKEVVLLTNAPRRASVIKEQLEGFGIPKDLYKEVISSGEATWNSMKKKTMVNRNKLNCYHIGPPRDFHLTEELDLKIVNEIEKADFILNTGPWGEDDCLENYKKILYDLSKLKLPMICSNPDKNVIRGNSFMICAGLLADFYEQLGGSVEYFGKPFSGIYQNCYEVINSCESGKILIVGDSLENDIKGANNQNLDSLLVASGIHRNIYNNKNVDIDKLNDLIKKKNSLPSFLIPEFTW